MYCVKCHKQYEPEKPKEVRTRNGMKAITGKCPRCGTKGFEFTGKA